MAGWKINLGLGYRLRTLVVDGTAYAAMIALLVTYLVYVLRLTPGWFTPDSIGHLGRVMQAGWLQPSLKPLGYDLTWKSLVALGAEPTSIMFVVQNIAYCAALAIAALTVRNRVLRVLLLLVALFNPIVLGVNLTNWALSLFFSLLIASYALSLLAIRSEGRARRYWLLAASAAAVGAIACEYRWEAHLFVIPVYFNLILGGRDVIPRFPGRMRALTGLNIAIYAVAAVILATGSYFAHKFKDEALLGAPRDPVRFACTSKLANLSGFLDVEMIPEAALTKKFRRMKGAERLAFYQRYHAENRFYDVALISSASPPAVDALRDACRAAKKKHARTLWSLHVQRVFISSLTNCMTATGVFETYRLTSRAKVHRWLRRKGSPIHIERDHRLERRMAGVERRVISLRSVDFGWGVGLFSPITVVLFAVLVAALVWGIHRYNNWRSRRIGGERSPIDVANLFMSQVNVGWYVALAAQVSNLEFRYFVVMYVVGCLSLVIGIDRLFRPASKVEALTPKLEELSQS